MTEMKMVGWSQDRHVGEKLTALRRQTGQSIEALASVVGVTVAEYSSFENGTERTSARQLYLLSEHCNVSIAFFFEGLGGTERAQQSLELVHSVA